MTADESAGEKLKFYTLHSRNISNGVSMSYLTSSEAVQLAEKIADHLKARNFEKRPHIALLGPRYRKSQTVVTTKLIAFKEEEDEVFSEKIEEETSERIIPYVTGFRASLQKISETTRIDLAYKFYLRVAPPSLLDGEGERMMLDQFRKVELRASILNAKELNVEMKIADDSDKLLYTSSVNKPLEEGMVKVTVPMESFQDATPHLCTLDEPFILMKRWEQRSGCRGKDERVYLATEIVYVPSFSLAISIKPTSQPDICSLIVRLTNEAGWIAERPTIMTPVSADLQKDFRFQVYDANGESWNVGYFFEVNGIITRIDGFRQHWRPTARGVVGMHTINSVYDTANGHVLFRDYAIDRETVPSVMKSASTTADFLTATIKEYVQLNAIPSNTVSVVSDALTTALRDNMQIANLYVFQEESTRKILNSIGSKKAVIIAARTAGGKTLAFLIPIATYCFIDKLGNGKPGVKAILFYPTKALCHDQADTILRLLWFGNLHLKNSGINQIVSMGILHGNTYSDFDIKQEMKEKGVPELQKELRYKCPSCGSRLVISFKTEQVVSSKGEEVEVEDEWGSPGQVLRWDVSCSGRENNQCPLYRGSPKESQELIEFLNKMLRPTRTAIYSNPPEILIATPDMMSYRLFASPNQHAIFGRSILRCTNCDMPFAQLSKKTCSQCHSKLSQILNFSYPQIIVFDEAHQLRGSFGSQVSFVISRLVKAVKDINNLENYQPLFIFSSATFNQPEKFAERFLDKRLTVERINAEYARIRAGVTEASANSYVRSHLFLMAKGYTPNACLTKVVQQIFKYFVQNKKRYPNVLIFANQLSMTSELINGINTSLSDFLNEEKLVVNNMPRVDGHSTDWDKDRADVEDRFSKGEIDVLVATRGLEVGVDFDRIDALIMYGAPFYVSDYLQRIGRAARNHSALAVSIHLEKPIDFFFLRNFRLISDLAIRDEALASEGSSITRDNPVIYKRTVARAVFDYLCTRNDAYEYYSQRIKGTTPKAKSNVATLINRLFDTSTAKGYLQALMDGSTSPPSRSEIVLNPELISYVGDAVGTRPETEENVLDVVTALMELVDEMDEGSLGSLVPNKIFNRKFFLAELRHSDYNVIVRYEDLQGLRRVSTDEYMRPRALGLAVGHYSPRQLSSYRKHAFIVTRVEPNTSESLEIERILKE
jgi:DEAD/DEAH box helicase domain-containing protein